MKQRRKRISKRKLDKLLKRQLAYEESNGEKGRPISLRNLDLSNMDLRGYDFSNYDLSYSSLAGSRLDNADFTSCTIMHTDFSEAILDNALFISSNGYETSFYHAHMNETRFDAAYLPYADFRGAYASNASFKEANLFGTGLPFVVKNEYAELSESQLSSLLYAINDVMNKSSLVSDTYRKKYHILNEFGESAMPDDEVSMPAPKKKISKGAIKKGISVAAKVVRWVKDKIGK